MSNDLIIDCQWFKDDESRFQFIRENNLEIINSMDYYSD